ncbi:hypothetical protein SCWH03_16040 [Streptomyces pacificus]|uniref:Uncharacterized protein n=1 Tax=Streptomyces pacificus TaxID=2705029 RepID=A0A6A0ARQ9_9ACTN|nr:hypothetical protein SCWH03_16040 [Streptomyces pacificus]
MVDLLAMMTFSLGVSQFRGATGLNMPHAPKTARITTATTAPGTTARRGRGAPSSDPVVFGCTNCATSLRFAKVYALSSSRRDAICPLSLSPSGDRESTPVPGPAAAQPPTMPAGARAPTLR